MKLTNNTTPQARNYQCDGCKNFRCHADMVDESICYDCESNINADMGVGK